MRQTLTREVCGGIRTDPRVPGAIGLAIAVGVAHFLAAQLSFALIARSDGLAMFWLAGGVSSSVVIVLGRSARLAVASAIVASMIVATLMGHRNIWISTAFALCNVGDTVLAAWLIERYFGSPFSLDSLRNVLGLLAAAVAANAASAVGAMVASRLLLSPAPPNLGHLASLRLRRRTVVAA